MPKFVPYVILSTYLGIGLLGCIVVEEIISLETVNLFFTQSLNFVLP